MKKKVLYIEDETSLGKIVMETLQRQDFEVEWRTDGATVLRTFSSFRPDICVLDIMLPNVDGFTLCAQIRKQHPHLPIIFLTAKTETADLVKGFEAGGNDYIRKPFSMEELIVRIHNLLKLKEGIRNVSREQPEEIRLGSYLLYPRRYELVSPSQSIKLSQRDIEVLNILVAYRNQSTDRKQLLMSVWGDDSFFNSRTLDVYIRKLRNYFSEDPSIEIVTLKGKGYLFLVG
ncbi:MAG: response regulator transcription factor [Bacteroidales bacterium]|nr:response regulator transcription factor [Bacteroidales bacterium]